MSRSIRGSNMNREIWSRRANGAGTGWRTHWYIKRRTHKIERQEGKGECRAQA
jgi:hypothetical protein